MEILTNIDAETLYTGSSLLGILVVSSILFVAKKLAAKTETTKDDELVDKLRQINKENIKKLKKK